MHTLGIETATDLCSVALMRDDTVLRVLSVSKPRSHASQLVPLIQRILTDEGTSPSGLDVIAVSAGPGSYTGLRIGASTAKGLAFATDAALVAVPTLEALAHVAAPIADHPLLCVLPSRRGEVYAALYQAAGGAFQIIEEPATLRLADLDAWLPDGELSLVGPASEVVMEAAGNRGTLDWIEVPPSAVSVAQLGYKRFLHGQTENVADWEPYYLKSFVAKPPRPIFG